MSYDEDAVLITVIEVEKNNNGFPQEKTARTEAFVGKKATNRTEAYKAMREGKTVAVTLEMDVSEYEAAIKEVNGVRTEPKYAEYNGRTYRIMRTYEPRDETMELILEEG